MENMDNVDKIVYFAQLEVLYFAIKVKYINLGDSRHCKICPHASFKLNYLCVTNKIDYIGWRIFIRLNSIRAIL